MLLLQVELLPVELGLEQLRVEEVLDTGYAVRPLCGRLYKIQVISDVEKRLRRGPADRDSVILLERAEYLARAVVVVDEDDDGVCQGPVFEVLDVLRIARLDKEVFQVARAAAELQKLVRLIGVVEEVHRTLEGGTFPRSELRVKSGEFPDRALEIDAVGLAFADDERTVQPNEIAVF